MRGDLVESFAKGAATVTRAMEPDRLWTSPSGEAFALHGRSVMFVRNVGHLMTTPMIKLPNGAEAPEGLCDAVITSLCSLHDVKGLGSLTNSRAGSIYIVKPKQHGPEECGFTDRLFDAVEDMRSEEHTSELQSLMRISYAVFCLKKKKKITTSNT